MLQCHRAGLGQIYGSCSVKYTSWEDFAIIDSRVLLFSWNNVILLTLTSRQWTKLIKCKLGKLLQA